MGKVLLTKKNYQEHLRIVDQVAYIENNMIITPSVKDILRNKSVSIKYGQRSSEESKSSKACSLSKISNEVIGEQESCETKDCSENKLTKEQMAAVVEDVLQAEFGKVETAMVETVLTRILSERAF